MSYMNNSQTSSLMDAQYTGPIQSAAQRPLPAAIRQLESIVSELESDLSGLSNQLGQVLSPVGQVPGAGSSGDKGPSTQPLHSEEILSVVSRLADASARIKSLRERLHV